MNTDNSSTKITRGKMPWPVALVDDLVFSGHNEQEILDTHKVSRRRYYAYLGDTRFLNRLQNRIDASRNRNTLLIARNAAKAVDKIVETLDADPNSAAARKARLDLITINNADLKNPATKKSDDDANTAQSSVKSGPELTPEQQDAILEALAQTES